MISLIKKMILRRQKRKKYERARDMWLMFHARPTPEIMRVLAAERMMEAELEYRGVK